MYTMVLSVFLFIAAPGTLLTQPIVVSQTVTHEVTGFKSEARCMEEGKKLATKTIADHMGERTPRVPKEVASGSRYSLSCINMG